MALVKTTTADLARQGAARELTRSSPWGALKSAAAVLGTSVAAVALLGSGAPGAQKPPPGVHGEVHFAVWSVDSDGPDFQAILSGAIGDYGPAETVLPNGQVDPEHTSEMVLRLHHGTFRLYIDGIASEFRAKAAHEPVYPSTCSDYVNVAASLPVVAGSGTGAYRGIRGDFSSTLSGYEDEKSQPCGNGFLAQILVLTGSGTVS
ncbi:MAG TPA: hypothetical protein VME46_21050 [Acidimicrobiales bacterium]|nr:hypothetical protein [Acidimicrobiales bacterium]